MSIEEPAATVTPPDAVRVEHAAALNRWREVRDREIKLRRDKVWDGERVNGELAWTLVDAALADEKREAAARVQEAARCVHEVDVRRANVLLQVGGQKHALAASHLVQELRELEKAWCQLVVAGWRVIDAASEERRTAAALTRTAKDAAPSEEVRESITQGAAHQVPVEVDLDGPSRYTDRPEVALFGGAGDAADPRSEVFWESIGRLVRGGRDRAATHCGFVVLSRLRKAETKIKSAR
jgi:hypothetical protein